MNLVKAATFILMKPTGEILMQLRDDGRGEEEIKYPNMWCFPGGAGEKNESYTETLIREVKEEYDITLVSEQCDILLTYNHDSCEDKVFVCKVNNNIEPRLQEGAGMEWMNIEKIKTLELAWNQKQILSQVEDHITKILKTSL